MDEAGSPPTGTPGALPVHHDLPIRSAPATQQASPPLHAVHVPTLVRRPRWQPEVGWTWGALGYAAAVVLTVWFVDATTLVGRIIVIACWLSPLFLYPIFRAAHATPSECWPQCKAFLGHWNWSASPVGTNARPQVGPPKPAFPGHEGQNRLPNGHGDRLGRDTTLTVCAR
jgi:hypothetical protein